MGKRLALIGGLEFRPENEVMTRELLELSPSRRLTMVILAPRDVTADFIAWARANDFWRENIENMVRRLGGVFERVMIESVAEAEDPERLEILGRAEWLHVICIRPEDGMSLMSPALREVIEKAVERGALVSGSAGGAMIFCERAWQVTPELVDRMNRYDQNVRAGKDVSAEEFRDMELPFVECLGLVPISLLVPHFDRMGDVVRMLLPAVARTDALDDGRCIVGVDDNAALLFDGGRWIVRGPRTVTLIRSDLERHVFEHDAVLELGGRS